MHFKELNLFLKSLLVTKIFQSMSQIQKISLLKTYITWQLKIYAQQKTKQNIMPYGSLKT